MSDVLDRARSGQKGRVRLAAALWVVLLSVLLGAAAESRAESGEVAGPTVPAPPPPSTSDAAATVDVHRYGDADATCREWSDGCQICLRQDDGAMACSTPGIACLPKPTVCTARK